MNRSHVENGLMQESTTLISQGAVLSGVVDRLVLPYRQDTVSGDGSEETMSRSGHDGGVERQIAREQDRFKTPSLGLPTAPITI